MTSNAMQMDLEDWHRRYLEQTNWTREIRRALFNKAGLNAGDRVLEVGSGTGAALTRTAEEFGFQITGVDIDLQSLTFSKDLNRVFDLVQGDGHHLPLADGSFSAAFCHYLLLWVTDPVRVLTEMMRVTRPAGAVIALAEPDYGGRIDYPPPLDDLGRLQSQALQAQGADIGTGRKLGELFQQAGFEGITVGILGAQWEDTRQGLPGTEWKAIRADLKPVLSDRDLTEYEEIDHAAWAEGRRILYLPTFYAFGRGP